MKIINEMFLVKIKYFISDEPTQLLINGTRELAKVINLLSRTDRYNLETITKIGKIYNTEDLIQDLIADQKPEDLDCGVIFVSGKEKNDGCKN